MLNFNMMNSMSNKKSNTEAYAEWLDAKEDASRDKPSFWQNFAKKIKTLLSAWSSRLFY